MSSKSQPTEGEWKYRPSQSRQIVSDTGETVCKIHRGKKAQYNGPLVAAAKDNYHANVALLNAVRMLAQDQTVHDLGERMQQAYAAILKSEGETE